jgi:hypothetical protein
LETLHLTEEQLFLVGKTMEDLELWSMRDKKTKYLKSQLRKFIDFLKNDLSLVQEDYYMSVWMSLWMVCGIAVSSIFWLDFGMWNETTGWLIIGMIVWMFLWKIMDSNLKKENRVYKIK